MVVRKQRATTSKSYALDEDYRKCLMDAKRIHRYDEEFYLYKMGFGYWTSLSKIDYEMQPKVYALSSLECWKFEGKRWRKYK